MPSHTIFTKAERLSDIDYWCDEQNNVHNKYVNQRLLNSERDRSYEYKKYHRHNRKATFTFIEEVMELLIGEGSISKAIEVGKETKNWCVSTLEEFESGKKNIPAFCPTKNLEYLFNVETNVSYLHYVEHPNKLSAGINVKIGIRFNSPRFTNSNYLHVNHSSTEAEIEQSIKAFVMPGYCNNGQTQMQLYMFKKWIYGRLKFLKLDTNHQTESGKEFRLLRDYILSLEDHKYFLMFGKRQNLTELELMTMRI